MSGGATSSETAMAAISQYRLTRSHSQRSTSTAPMPAPNNNEICQAR